MEPGETLLAHGADNVEPLIEAETQSIARISAAMPSSQYKHFTSSE